MDIKKLLDEYSELVAHKDLILSDLATQEQGIIPAAVQMELDALRDEFNPLLEEADNKIQTAKEQLQNIGKQTGESVKGTYHNLSFYETPKWDDKKLIVFLSQTLTPDQLKLAMTLRSTTPVCKILQKKGR